MPEDTCRLGRRACPSGPAFRYFKSLLPVRVSLHVLHALEVMYYMRKRAERKSNWYCSKGEGSEEGDQRVNFFVIKKPGQYPRFSRYSQSFEIFVSVEGTHVGRVNPS